MRRWIASSSRFPRCDGSLGLSQRWLSQQAGLHVRTVARAEAGGKVSDEALLRLAQVLVPLLVFQPSASIQLEPLDDARAVPPAPACRGRRGAVVWVSDDLRRELAEWHRHDEDLVRSYVDERRGHDDRLEELLIRARDAGIVAAGERYCGARRSDRNGVDPSRDGCRSSARVACADDEGVRHGIVSLRGRALVLRSIRLLPRIRPYRVRLRGHLHTGTATRPDASDRTPAAHHRPP